MPLRTRDRQRPRRACCESASLLSTGTLRHLDARCHIGCRRGGGRNSRSSRWCPDDSRRNGRVPRQWADRYRLVAGCRKRLAWHRRATVRSEAPPASPEPDRIQRWSSVSRASWWHGFAWCGWCSVIIFLSEGLSPLGLPYTLSRAPLRRRAPFAWLTRCRSLAPWNNRQVFETACIVHLLSTTSAATVTACGEASSAAKE